MALEEFRQSGYIVWDTANKTITDNPQANSGDANGRTLHVVVKNSGVFVDLTGYTLNLGWKNADGTAAGLDAFTATDASQGEFEIYYTTGMLSNTGVLGAALQLIGGDGVIESDEFKITVNPSIIDPLADPSESSFTALTSALMQVNGWNARIDDVEQDFIDRANSLDATYPTRLVSVETGLAHNVKDYTYNLNALRKTRRNKYLNALAIGDSIGAGTAASGFNFGFLQQLLSAANVMQGNTIGGQTSWFYNNNTANGGSLSNWIATGTGIGNWLMKSQASSTALLLFPYPWVTPQHEYQVKLVYSKRPDGGTFDVGYGATVLATLSSAGAAQDGVISDIYTIPAGQVFAITPTSGQIAYVSHAFYSKDFTKDGTVLDLFVQGGRKALDFTVTDLQNTLTYSQRDLLIWELLENDYAWTDFAGYQNRVEATMTQARALDMDILIVITCGNVSTPADPNYRNQWVAYLYDVADRYDCAIIDYDKFFGGYTKAKADGLIFDTVHPTDPGHLLMANEAIPILLGIENPFNQSVARYLDDARQKPYGYIQDSRNIHFPNTITFAELYTQTNDQNGNAQYTMVQPITKVIYSDAQFPKYAPLGAIGSWENTLFVNLNDWGANQNTTVSNWMPVTAYPMLPKLTSQPSPTDANLGKLFRLSLSGKDDQIVTYRFKADGTTREWVALATTAAAWS